MSESAYKLFKNGHAVSIKYEIPLDIVLAHFMQSKFIMLIL